MAWYSWALRCLYWPYHWLAFVFLIKHLEDQPDVASSRLSSIYQTVALVAALLLAMTIDPLVNPPLCVQAESILISSKDVPIFIRKTCFILGLPVSYAISGCGGLSIVGGFVMYACYRPILYIFVVGVFVIGVLPLCITAGVLYYQIAHDWASRRNNQSWHNSGCNMPLQPNSHVGVLIACEHGRGCGYGAGFAANGGQLAMPACDQRRGCGCGTMQCCTTHDCQSLE
eukprot:354921-Chlamydomonas_euryale.AAC.6